MQPPMCIGRMKNALNYSDPCRCVDRHDERHGHLTWEMGNCAMLAVAALASRRLTQICLAAWKGKGPFSSAVPAILDKKKALWMR